MRQLVYWLCDAVAWLTYALGVRRDTALQNLARAGITGKSAYAILQRAHQNLARSIADLLWPPPIHWDGDPQVAELLSRGRGLIVVTGHIGAFDVLACQAAARGYAVHVVNKRLRPRWLDSLWCRWRRRSGLHIYHPGNCALALARALQAGQIVALVVDQHAPAPDGLPIEFFGEPAWTTLTPARLARATRAPIVPAFLLRRAHDLELVLGEPIRAAEATTGAVCADQTSTADLQLSALAYNQALEHIVRQCPDQWFWWHRRWKGFGAKTWPLATQTVFDTPAERIRLTNV